MTVFHSWRTVLYLKDLSFVLEGNCFVLERLEFRNWKKLFCTWKTWVSYLKEIVLCLKEFSFVLEEYYFAIEDIRFFANHTKFFVNLWERVKHMLLAYEVLAGFSLHTFLSCMCFEVCIAFAPVIFVIAAFFSCSILLLDLFWRLQRICTCRPL